MPSSFWSNTIWYVLLGITSAITMVLVLVKSKNRGFTIAFTLATFGFALAIEANLVLIFNAYSYYPKIVDDLFQDAVLGNLFSQVSIATTSALLIVYELSYGWYFVFAAIYYLIEELFLKLGIYQHFWYKSVYTFAGLIILFWVVKKWNNRLITSPKYTLHYITLFLGACAATLETIILPLKLSKTQIFQINFYGNLSKNHTTTSLFYVFLLISILIAVYKWRINWIFKGIVFIILFFIQYFLYTSNVIYFKDGWFVIGTIIDLMGMYTSGLLF